MAPLPVDLRATISCNPGHYLDGPSSTQCSPSGEWNPPLPICQPSKKPVIRGKPDPRFIMFLKQKSTL